MQLNVVISVGLLILLAISIISTAVVLFNFLLLLSELNKRMIYVISDILGDIDLSTPHIDTLGNTTPIDNVEDIIGEESEESYFNPHEFDVDEFEKESK